MKEITGEEILALQRQIGCSVECTLIAIEFRELDPGMSLEERLILAWRRSLRFADYREERAQCILSEFLNKVNLGH